ncbi:DUF2062 domain-containing protein [Parvibium lacunae]|uniref:DUF2062 domain-containing protein n=1 Tax=Parvibium lacunae TaxID=1888893 RepID=A0A368L8U2_9BURK|nr:DUF2062 domain-containing protein [Parvibium lacunae]RCS59649.1 DUF2062 domain-containing protein [Parvibium lacunae]
MSNANPPPVSSVAQRSWLRIVRRKLRHILPDSAQIRSYKILHLFGERLFHPALWGINRHTVAKGVAIGLFCGLIPGPLQVLGSAIACLYLRGNLPLAILSTFYTNPFTILPLYYVAYHYGALVMGDQQHQAHSLSIPNWNWQAIGESTEQMMQWASGLGAPLAVGILLLASTLALSSYLTITLVWNWRLRRIWWRRLAQHQQLK